MKKLLVFLILFFSLSSNVGAGLERITDENRVDIELANKEAEDYFRNKLIRQSLTEDNSFTGIIYSSGRQRPAVTSFFIDNEGKIAGNYIWYEGYNGFLPIGHSGDLYDCIIFDTLILKCTWKDEGGVGVFQVRFTKYFNSFRDEYEYYWTGDRSEQKRIATEKRITDWLESRKRECSTTIC